MTTDTAKKTKRRRGSPLFPFFARAWKTWCEAFPHVPAELTKPERARYLAVFTIALQRDVLSRLRVVLEAGRHCPARATFRTIVDDAKRQLRDRWPAELDISCSRIQAAARAYAKSEWHCETAAKTGRPPWKPFDIWISSLLPEWIETARKKGLLQPDGKPLAVVSPPTESDLATLRSDVRTALASSESARHMLAWMPTRHDRGRDRERKAITARGWSENAMDECPKPLRDRIENAVDARTDFDNWDPRFAYRFLTFLVECLADEKKEGVRP